MSSLRTSAAPTLSALYSIKNKHNICICKVLAQVVFFSIVILFKNVCWVILRCFCQFFPWDPYYIYIYIYILLCSQSVTVPWFGLNWEFVFALSKSHMRLTLVTRKIIKCKYSINLFLPSEFTRFSPRN